jgi:hypothetical protein
MNIKKYETHELFGLYSSVIEELMDRKVIRTANNPVADFAEYLVAQKMHLKLAASSTAGYDALDEKGVRYQIKSRRNNDHNNSRQLGVIRNLEQDKFDYLVGIIFNRDFNVLEAYQIPHRIILSYARFSKHQNGYILQLKGEILSDILVENVTHIFT